MRNQKERDTKTQGYILFVMDTPRGVPALPPQKLTAVPRNQDGGTLCTVLDARTYMLALPKRRETAAQWQRAAELLLAQADVAEVISRYCMTPSWTLRLRRRNEDANQFRPPSRYVGRRRVGGILATVECKICSP